MILSKRAALGGVQLDELHESIVVQRVDPGTPQRNISAVAMMGGAGQRITGDHWETLDIIVEFGINLPKRQMELRRHLFTPGHGLKQLLRGVLGVAGHEADEKIPRHIVDHLQQVGEVDLPV
jgi:hypothetical protein